MDQKGENNENKIKLIYDLCNVNYGLDMHIAPTTTLISDNKNNTSAASISCLQNI